MSLAPGFAGASIARSSMLEDHLICPKCGYDLYGIPEVRCPECGFRYDAAALRSLAREGDWARLWSAHDLAKWGSISAFLSMPPVCDALGFDAGTQVMVLAVTCAVACVAWVWVTGLRPSGWYAWWFLPFAPLFGGLLIVRFPRITLVGAGLSVAYAWIIRFTDWPPLAPQANVRSIELQRMVIRWSRFSMSVLWMATFLVVLAFAN